MKYLVLASRRGSNFSVQIINDNCLSSNYYVFVTMEQATRDFEVITSDNLFTFTAPVGRLYGNIEDIEPIMRAMGCRKCDICGEWITPQDIRSGASTWDGSKRKCPLCIAKETEKIIPLHGYHDTEDMVRVINGADENFTVSNVLGIGIEVEYYNGRSNRETLKSTNAFYEIANDNSLNRMFRCERDGTVTGEIISNIFTKKSLYDFDFSILTDVLKLNGNIDGNTYAGLHVHLSKLWLGTEDKEQVLNFLKLQYFMKSYEEDFLKLCGRKREHMDWCKFFSLSEIERMKSNILTHDNPWRYMPCSHGGGVGCALNSSGATIEYRIGANTNDPERMKHYIYFILGIVENIKNVPFSKCYCLRKVTKLVPQETMNYWRKQGCFLNTNAINERGVTL